MVQSHYRTCTKCLQEKTEDDFGWRNKDLGIRQTRCKTCVSEASANWYLRNRDKHIQNVAKNRKLSRPETRQYVWDYLLTHPCVDCGESDPIVLEFDHVRGQKIDSVAKMVAKGYSLGSIIAEIEKCEVRCANCHREKSIIQFGWFNKKNK
jgi:hypothetical protein